MATTGAVGGSQLDVQSLASQLVAAERSRPDAQIAKESSRVTTQISAVGQLMGSLSTFRNALSSLKTVDLFSARTATSSSEEALTVSASAKAVPGSYEIEVVRLAQAHQISSTPFADGSDSVVGTGKLTVSLGDQSFEVDIAEGDNTLADIRDAINGSAKNVGVRATLVQGTDGSRLVLSSSATGAENKIEIAQSGGDGGLATLTYSAAAPANYTVIKAAQDAVINIAGAQTTSASNTVEDAIDGVTLTLKEPTTEESGPVTVSVGYDRSTVNKRIETFVNAYNALMSQVARLRSYDAATKVAGPMLGDSMLTGIENEMRRTISSAMPGQPPGFDSLASIGITTQANGTLAVDSAKLQKALNGNFEAVGKLFGSEQGIAARLYSQADDRLEAGGVIDTRTKNLTEQQRALTKRKDDLDARMVVMQKAYVQQFTRLDTLLSQLQVTSSYLSQQIESLANLKK